VTTPTVTVPNFEGPLGLLLELVENGKLEVTDIAVGTVTRQYLDRVNSLSELGRDDLAQFLELGARLVHIKSLALLPAGPDDELPLAELRQLNQELAEYRLLQQAMERLRSRLNEGKRSYIRTSQPKLSGVDLPKPELDLVQLGALFNAALERTKPAPTMILRNHHYDQAEIANRLVDQARDGEIRLDRIIAACRDRLEIIVTFLAVLELVRSDTLSVKQNDAFGEMRLVMA
jgi:segregation and condensation protein A